MKSFKVIFFLKLQLKNEKTISIHLSDFDGLQCWGYEGFNWDQIVVQRILNINPKPRTTIPKSFFMDTV